MPGDLSAAFAAIDAANAQSPTGVEGRDAELAVEWVRRLRKGDPPEALLLAARAHHVRRWDKPRSTYPEGRAGYLRWKRDLQAHHAAVVAPLLRDAGYDDETVERVQAIVRKQRLSSDPDVQALEDALCIVFLQTQFSDLAARLDGEKMVDILRKSLAKMSDEGRAAALSLEPALSDAERALLRAALERQPPA
ncbi:MAG: hypothetical protein QOI20_1475 [Acidimicrobiaceae bacterium]|jgi:hypothetical protein|nr:hypothetical protein [Acidimicrobiaceae bacterium]